MEHDDFEIESIPGLPGELPAGETLLWQGRPSWRGLAIHTVHARKIAIYFAILGAASILQASAADARGTAMLATLPALALAAAVACGLVVALAVLIRRTTIYSITTARVVVRTGIALPMSVNLPFAIVDGAALRARSGGEGDIVLVLQRAARVSWTVLWPHVRPWKWAHPEPMLRDLPDAHAVASLLTDALRRHAGQAAASDAPELAQSGPRSALDDPSPSLATARTVAEGRAVTA